MGSQERKTIFVSLLNEMLAECGGVKSRLAKQFQIAPSSLTYWLQGKIDPGELSIATFTKIAEVKGLSTDELADFLGFFEYDSSQSVKKFRKILEELLQNTSQDALAKKTGISQGAISKWLDSKKQFQLDNISAIRMAVIAKEKGWTLERLLNYLDLKAPESEDNLFFKLQSGANILSLYDRVRLLAWLSSRVQQEIIHENTNTQFIQSQKNRTICVLLEKDNLAIASNYSSNLVHHVHIEPDNIMIATITQFEEVKEDLDLIIFDIETNSSNTIDRINKISFDGDVVIFTSPELEEEVRQQLEDKVTDIVVKPIDWQELKNKPYFS